jgi:Ca2+-binding RTX toxin-like protein
MPGGPGRDVIVGGDGQDTAVFEGLADSGAGNKLRDIFRDFDPAEDRIDLPGDFDYIVRPEKVGRL